jgi:hypothetical protein
MDYRWQGLKNRHKLMLVALRTVPFLKKGQPF